jgi:hypothetical protein
VEIDPLVGMEDLKALWESLAIYGKNNHSTLNCYKSSDYENFSPTKHIPNFVNINTAYKVDDVNDILMWYPVSSATHHITN